MLEPTEHPVCRKIDTPSVLNVPFEPAPGSVHVSGARTAGGNFRANRYVKVAHKNLNDEYTLLHDASVS